MEIVLAAIGVVLGGVIAVAVAIWIEQLRRPKMSLVIEPPDEIIFTPANLRARSLKVRVSNSALTGLESFMVRAPALQARGVITFHRYGDGQDIFGKPMAGRWASGLQPTAIPVRSVANGNIDYQILDPQMAGAGSRVDIYPGESEVLDVAVRVENDDECYGFNNEMYFIPTFGRNPDWRLGRDRFLVKIVIVSSGQRCIGVFRLINDVPRSSFRLEDASPQERSRVT
jgi:hypothetical protein